MSLCLKSVVLLTLVSLSGCSVARHGPVPVRHMRIHWPRPEPANRQQPGRAVVSRHNPTYSVHHYKHAAKAAIARNLAGDGGVQVSYPQPGLMPTGNYKMPVANEVPTGGVVIGHGLRTSLAGSNYEMPRPVRLLSIPSPERSGQPSSARPGAGQHRIPQLESLNRLPTPTTLNSHSLTNKVN